MKKIYLPPNAPVLMESTRAIGYSLEAAVADIIDNSISAKAQRIEIFFSALNNPYFAILDDGYGMNSDELNNAMQYGSKQPSEKREATDLGRFGLGLKTASLSQCRSLTVISKKNQHINARRWDLDTIIETNDWTLLILGKDDINELPKIELLQKLKSGTLVIWSNLDRLCIGEDSANSAFNKKLPLLREHLALVFHRFLEGEKFMKRIKIAINNLELDSIDPFLQNKSHQIMDIEEIIIENEIVKVKPFILPHQSKISKKELDMLSGHEGLRQRQGFYVYRNRRLIVWGTWFRMVKRDDLSSLARVMVDIPNSLDEQWTLDIKKSVAVPPELVKRNLRRIIDKIAESSKRVYRTRGRRESSGKKIQPWIRIKNRDNTIQYDINRKYPLIENLKKKLNNSQKTFFEQIVKIIESNLPINSMRVDFGGDEHVSLDDLDEKKFFIEETVRTLFIDNNEIGKTKKTLLSIEPFASYKDIVEKIYKEVK